MTKININFPKKDFDITTESKTVTFCFPPKKGEKVLTIKKEKQKKRSHKAGD